MTILYIVIFLVVIFIVRSNIKMPRLERIGEIAFHQFFITHDEKYKVMLCVLAATFQNDNKERFWRYFESLPEEYENDSKIELRLAMEAAGNGCNASLQQKNILSLVDPVLLQIIKRSDLNRCEEYRNN